MAYSTTFKYRKGWRAQAEDKTGKRHTKDFARKVEAKEWAAGILSAQVSADAPAPVLSSKELTHAAREWKRSRRGP